MNVILTSCNIFNAIVGHNKPTIKASRQKNEPQPKTQSFFVGTEQCGQVIIFVICTTQ